MSAPLATPHQTAGPYVALGLCYGALNEIVPPGAPGAVEIRGSLRDGEGELVGDGVVEIWQADASGTYQGDFGFGRCSTHDDPGEFAFVTVKPGRVPWTDGTPQAPHINVYIHARGLLRPLHTRLYFPDEPEVNADDPVLSALRPEQQAAMVARADGDGFRWDIALQGTGAPAFFAVEHAGVT